MFPNSSQLDQLSDPSFGKWKKRENVLIATGSQRHSWWRWGREKHGKENKYNWKQNVGEDTSQLSVGKHIPHKQQSQSIYHTVVNPSRSCVCVCVHVCPYCMCVCTKGGGKCRAYWIIELNFHGLKVSERGEKKTWLIKNRCFLIVCHAKCWNIKNCRDDYSQSQHYQSHLPWKNKHGQYMSSGSVTRSWNPLQTKWK